MGRSGRGAEKALRRKPFTDGTCFEDNNWRPLTPYDSASIMHYPQCNGSSNDLSMTSTDRQGAVALYGS